MALLNADEIDDLMMMELGARANPPVGPARRPVGSGGLRAKVGAIRAFQPKKAVSFGSGARNVGFGRRAAPAGKTAGMANRLFGRQAT